MRCARQVWLTTDPDILLRHPKQHGGLYVTQRRGQTRLELLDAVAKGNGLQQSRLKEQKLMHWGNKTPGSNSMVYILS